MLSSAKELKFMIPVIPDDNSIIDLKVEYNEVDNGYKVACLFTAGDKIFCKLKGVFSAE
jgi:3-hydroxymyristoyl/3-hydroxydecanoyl-(acyl carrier protein) dehydratase